ncbi:SSI family serine proteinase inhibitor [Kitasatospora sp. NPDC004289]
MRPVLRPARLARRSAVLAAVLAALVPVLPAAAQPREAGPSAGLGITVRDGIDGTVRHWTLRCGPTGPTGGNHPGQEAACGRLVELAGDFTPLRNGPVADCPRDYDPRTLEISGYWNGEFREFEEGYPNPCHLERLTAPLVPAAG